MAETAKVERVAKQLEDFSSNALTEEAAATLRALAAQRDKLVRQGDRLADAVEGGCDLTDALNAWDKARAAIARATGESQ